MKLTYGIKIECLIYDHAFTFKWPYLPVTELNNQLPAVHVNPTPIFKYRVWILKSQV